LEVDYKVGRVVEKLAETDHKLAAIGKALDQQKDGPLFGEFTTRGVLSTLKVRVSVSVTFRPERNRSIEVADSDIEGETRDERV
jgi:hypothetical protein